MRAAMPGFIARKLCPELIFVPVDFKKYTHYSDLTRKGLETGTLLLYRICSMIPHLFFLLTTWIHLFTLVFQKYDSNFLAASLDEAYLDITNVCQERGITGAEVS